MKVLNLMLTIIAVAIPASTVNATPVVFDFEQSPYLGGLPVGSLAGAVEDYMEDIYGSDITVSSSNLLSGIVGNGIHDGPLGKDEGKDHDQYIQAGPSCGTHWVSFSFNEVPITAVSFDWGVRINIFHAYADDSNDAFFSSQGWDCWTSGNSGIIYFDSPVTTLKFSDSCLGEIEVDNLTVIPVPEPATIVILGLGTLVLLRRQSI